ncbi:MAG TPA: leucine--tRNA ligase [Chitinophagaceae bacterium]|nr:leucine--tRNA ligase [Chitinophagaceae bacterium]
MEYIFRDIEKKWQTRWKESGIYSVPNDPSKPKCYVLDMFPYPSGAGLHVGHPLGYIASDIYSRYKRLKGFNVLHPMGYDAFGLPAEQYAIDHGIHPAVSTENNIANFRRQLDNMGFCFDWDREVRTSDPRYYKWTQWIFLQLFNSWYNRQTNKTEPITKLVGIFEKEGNNNHPVPNPASEIFETQDALFTAGEWNSFDEYTRESILMEYRVAYCGVGEVNWCEALGTVLANDEVINGVSERGGHPVVRKKLRQWYLRITEYADRLLDGLAKVEFSDAMKEMQTNWIGKSSGAEIDFSIKMPPLSSPKGEYTAPQYQTATPSLYSITKKLAEEKRKNPTQEEEVLWKFLRAHKTGFHIRRQHIMGAYIVDFACLDKLVTIEIDGGYHDDPEVQFYDRERTTFLTAHGYLELRFTNTEVKENVEGVLNKIQKVLSQRPSIPKNTGYSEVSPLGGDLEGALKGEAFLRVYTTRPDTIYGVDFMVIAPELDLVNAITTKEQEKAVQEYLSYVKSRSERERMAEKKITGVFTGSYAVNPMNGREIPVWISEYVLAGYGTGAIMAVPCGDERDHKFARHFGIPITNIIGDYYNGEEANPTKEAKLQNSDFLNGIEMTRAAEIVIAHLELAGLGKRKVNYKMRDAAFSRQRYWGEPFPIIWKNGIAYPLPESELPLTLPEVTSYSPGPDGEGPLANIKDWINQYDTLDPALGGGGALETNTMPGYAGSSWYFLRYMDPHNEKEFCSRKASDYWGQVDLYIGGTEHAVGHLLYSRMWTKALYDLGHIGHDEPYRRLVNQGMIQGSSRFVYRIHGSSKFVSAGLKDKYEIDEIHVDVNIVDGVELDTHAFKQWKKGEFADAEFILEGGKYICGVEIEKMSKSKFNTVNPDDLVAKYGADTFRMYEMFLGPVEMSKPWDTKGIEGVHRFLKKFWRLFADETKGWLVNDEPASAAELKVLHHAIRKIENDTEKFSFNTGVSSFMIATNELTDLKCHKRSILEPLLILLAPYAPHIAEELYAKLQEHFPKLNKEGASVLDAVYPVFEEKYVKETSKEYPVSVNGKTRTTIDISLEAAQPEVEQIVLNNEVVQKWLEGRQPKKIIFVKGKMVNVVV